MPIKHFNPILDGLSAPYEWTLKLPEFNRVDEILDAALPIVLTHLRETYRGAIEAYEIKAWLEGWIEFQSPTPAALINTGLLYVVLDHYYARRLITKARKRLTGKRAVEFNEYIARRTYESYRSKVVAQLKTVAIKKLMPDSWVRESVITDAIKREIKAINGYSRITVEYDLQIPLSGKKWLLRKTMEALEILKRKLDNNRPQPITYIIKTDHYLFVDRTVIAYDYHLTGQHAVKIFIYDLEDNEVDKSICFCLPRENRLRNYGEIEGFYLEDYEPEPIPLSGWIRFLQVIFPWRTLLWYIKRIIFHINLTYKKFRRGKTDKSK